MGSHITTTLDLSGPLLEEAKAVAARERTTLRALVEEGLRAVLARKRSSKRFRPRGLAVRNPLLTDAAREQGPSYGRRRRVRA
jgi:hypothetical protein